MFISTEMIPRRNATDNKVKEKCFCFSKITKLDEPIKKDQTSGWWIGNTAAFTSSFLAYHWTLFNLKTPPYLDFVDFVLRYFQEINRKRIYSLTSNNIHLLNAYNQMNLQKNMNVGSSFFFYIKPIFATVTRASDN